MLAYFSINSHFCLVCGIKTDLQPSLSKTDVLSLSRGENLVLVVEWTLHLSDTVEKDVWSNFKDILLHLRRFEEHIHSDQAVVLFQTT